MVRQATSSSIAESGSPWRCWGIGVVVWVVAARYNASHAPRTRTRGASGSPLLIGVVGILVAALVILGRAYGDHLVVSVSWVRALGLVVLVISTAFTLWARVALGIMWSLNATTKDEHQLRTHGPYAVTRHPIYTGLLGMLLGTTLLNGICHWVVLVPIGLILLQVKDPGGRTPDAGDLPGSVPGLPPPGATTSSRPVRIPPTLPRPSLNRTPPMRAGARYRPALPAPVA